MAHRDQQDRGAPSTWSRQGFEVRISISIFFILSLGLLDSYWVRMAELLGLTGSGVESCWFGGWSAGVAVGAVVVIRSFLLVVSLCVFGSRVWVFGGLTVRRGERARLLCRCRLYRALGVSFDFWLFSFCFLFRRFWGRDGGPVYNSGIVSGSRV